MAIKKRTGNESNRPAIGKTSKSTRVARFVDLNDGLDKVVNFSKEEFVKQPESPVEGGAVVWDGEKYVSEVPSGGDSRPYKVYTALLTQTGTNAPVATVLENTLGVGLTFVRNNIGSYTISGLASLTTNPDKVIFQVILTDDAEGEGVISKTRNTLDPGDLNFLFIFTLDLNDSNIDGVLSRTPVEIRVYND